MKNFRISGLVDDKYDVFKIDRGAAEEDHLYSH